MYWPYLRNRTNEVFAIKEIAPKIALNRLVVPIFQLVAVDKDFKNRAAGIAKLGQRFCLLINAYRAASISAAMSLIDDLDAGYPGIVFPGVEILHDTPVSEITGFVSKYSSKRCVIVHRSAWGGGNLNSILAALAIPPVHVYLISALQGVTAPSVTAGNVILTDGFLRQATNGAYPAQSVFHNHATTFANAGYNGFGDFGPVGDYYRVGGGQASHVALHLTQFGGNSLVCNHFVSHTVPVLSHIHVKYDDALSQLRGYALPNASGFNTAGVSDYHYPHVYRGLGMPKRWSIKHHVELMNSFLAHAGATAFV